MVGGMVLKLIINTVIKLQYLCVVLKIDFNLAL